MPFFYSHFFQLNIWQVERKTNKEKETPERNASIDIHDHHHKVQWRALWTIQNWKDKNEKKQQKDPSNHSLSGMSACCFFCLSCRGIKCPQFFDNFSFNTKRTFPFLNLLLGFMFHRVFAGHKKTECGEAKCI